MGVMNRKNRVTIGDVARLAGVSTKSISRVINDEVGVSEETRQNILNAIASLGYVANPAAQRLRGSPNTLGLILSGFEDYAGQLISGMSRAVQRLNYSLILYVQDTNPRTLEAYRSFVGSGLIAGLLMIVPNDYHTLIDLCDSYGIPYATVDSQGTTSTRNLSVITTTNANGISDVMYYLIDLGHRKIGFITGNLDMASARERLQGYRDALHKRELPFESSLVIRGDWSQSAGFHGARELMQTHSDITAIIASDDLTAFGVMDAIKDAGFRVGQDISVTGFDDIPMSAKVYPPLTTVRQPMIQMGEAAVELLVAVLDKHQPNNIQREFSTELVIRQSTGKPAK